MLKSVIIRLFLQKEVSALRIRLAEASDALKRIESDVVAIDAEASEETRELAEKILTRVLSSADQVRSRDAGFL